MFLPAGGDLFFFGGGGRVAHSSTRTCMARKLFVWLGTTPTLLYLDSRQLQTAGRHDFPHGGCGWHPAVTRNHYDMHSALEACNLHLPCSTVQACSSTEPSVGPASTVAPDGLLTEQCCEFSIDEAPMSKKGTAYHTRSDLILCQAAGCQLTLTTLAVRGAGRAKATGQRCHGTQFS